MPAIDPVALTRELIRRPSVTPADEGAMEVVERALASLGFACRRMRFGEIENLYAKRGTAGPNLCFAGHTDVVPVGDVGAWRHAPFAADLDGEVLHGRGAVDMKSAIAAFIAAVGAVLAKGEPAGSLSLLITGDEEGIAEDGTKAVVAALAGMTLVAALPTSMVVTSRLEGWKPSKPSSSTRACRLASRRISTGTGLAARCG